MPMNRRRPISPAAAARRAAEVQKQLDAIAPLPPGSHWTKVRDRQALIDSLILKRARYLRLLPREAEAELPF